MKTVVILRWMAKNIRGQNIIVYALTTATISESLDKDEFKIKLDIPFWVRIRWHKNTSPWLAKNLLRGGGF